MVAVANCRVETVSSLPGPRPLRESGESGGHCCVALTSSSPSLPLMLTLSLAPWFPFSSVSSSFVSFRYTLLGMRVYSHKSRNRLTFTMETPLSFVPAEQTRRIVSNDSSFTAMSAATLISSSSSILVTIAKLLNLAVNSSALIVAFSSLSSVNQTDTSIDFVTAAWIKV